MDKRYTILFSIAVTTAVTTLLAGCTSSISSGWNYVDSVPVANLEDGTVVRKFKDGNVVCYYANRYLSCLKGE